MFHQQPLRLRRLLRRKIQHDVVSPLDQQQVLGSGADLLLDDDRHALPRRIECVGGEHLVLDLHRRFRRLRGRLRGFRVFHDKFIAPPLYELPPEVCSRGNEGELVGALGFVEELALRILRRHHGVGHGQRLQEAIDILLLFRVLPGTHHIALSREASNGRTGAVEAAEGFSADGQTLELHVVLGQRACLVGKDVAHLAEFCAEIRRTRFREEGLLFKRLLGIHHIPVVRDEVALERIAELDSRVEGDWHQVRIQREKRQAPTDELRKDDLLRKQIPMLGDALADEGVAKCAHNSQAPLHGQDNQHSTVRDHLQIRLLHGGRSAVPDHPRIRTGVDDQAEAECCVPEHGAPHEQLLPAQGLRARPELQAAVEVMDVGAWRLRFHRQRCQLA
mmetsp:Transcript_77480/g.224813  ORF Transcript_77480/g.224813 Transcript_77480/m.224813 type:complete len:391 (-) Transcript_77480:716-1888(-)